MTDVVWMRLTIIETGTHKVEERMGTFLFGHGGIKHFRATEDGKNTLLFNTSITYDGDATVVVKEDEETIFKLIAKVRGTA